MSDIINQNTEPLFIFDMPDDETLSETISVKGEKGERGDPTKLSQLDNDTGFITNAVTNLLNYYSKSESYSQAQVDSLLAKTRNIDGKDLNTLVGERIVGYGNGCVNKPTNSNGYFINIPHSQNSLKNNYNKQFWFVRDTNVIYARSQVNGTFGDWARVNPDMTQYYTKTESDTLRNTNDYYDEITYTKERHYDTDCYFVTVPTTDSNNEQIKLFVGDAGSGGSPLKFAQTSHTTLTTNCSLTIVDTVDSSNSGIPIIIGDGTILRNHPMISEGVADNFLYLGIKADRSIVEYRVNETDAQTMLDDGCEQVFDVYYKIVENGTATDLSNVVTNEPNVTTDKHPRQCLGVKSDGTIIFLSCDGRTSIDAGLTSGETAQLLIDKGCINAWNLDGGGSTSTEIKESKLNRNIDGNGTADRKIRYTLNVKKPTTNTALAKAYSKISEEKQNIIGQIIPLVNAAAQSGITTATTDIGGKDLDELVDKIYIGYGNGDIHRPTDAPTSGYFVNIPHSESQYIGAYAKQLYFERDGSRIWTRNLVAGTFTEWVRVYQSDKAFLRSDTEAHTIQAANTYETIPIRWSTIDSDVIGLAEYDSSISSYGGFTVGKRGYVRLRAQVQLTAATTGDKLMSFWRGSTQLGGSIVKCRCQQGVETIITTEVMANVSSSNTSEVYYLKVYGAAGDTLSRAKISIEAS